jgi:hypothetical protein
VSGRPHGLSRYQTDRCRCFTCRIAKAEYRRLADGSQMPGYVDARPVREHVEALRSAGYSTRRLWTVSGVARDTLKRLQHVDAVQHKVAAALLALPVGAPPPPQSGRYVPSVGTHRRVHALTALGWSLSYQAKRIGMPQTQMTRTIVNPTLEPKTADRVRGLYDELSLELPKPSHWVTRVREVARLAGRFPPLAWDDETIDDPDAIPCLLPPVEPVDRELELLVQHLVAGHPVEPTVDAIREVIRRAPDRKVAEVARLAQTTPGRVSNIKGYLLRVAS